MNAYDRMHMIVQARAGGRVERGHNCHHLGSYSNAAHSWGVAMLMWYLWPEDFPRLALICLAHDVPEAWVGDIPAPVGRYLPGLKAELTKAEKVLAGRVGLPADSDLNEEDHAKLKACDRLEFYMWCREQLAQGNQFARDPLTEITHYLDVQGLPAPADAVYREMRSSDLLPRQTGVMREMFGEGEQA